jgi:hypothetical protein
MRPSVRDLPGLLGGGPQPMPRAAHESRGPRALSILSVLTEIAENSRLPWWESP